MAARTSDYKLLLILQRMTLDERRTPDNIHTLHPSRPAGFLAGIISGNIATGFSLQLFGRPGSNLSRLAVRRVADARKPYARGFTPPEEARASGPRRTRAGTLIATKLGRRLTFAAGWGISAVLSLAGWAAFKKVRGVSGAVSKLTPSLLVLPLVGSDDPERRPGGEINIGALPPGRRRGQRGCGERCSASRPVRGP